MNKSTVIYVYIHVNYDVNTASHIRLGRVSVYSPDIVMHVINICVSDALVHAM